MQQKQLAVELRSKTGKGISRQLRSADKVPGVVYGKGMDPIPVAVNYRELQSIFKGEAGHNNLISLTGCGELDKMLVIVADIQQDAMKRRFQHIDFHKVTLDAKVRVTIPVHIVGIAAGVKEGGIQDIIHHELHAECLPGNIPEFIEIYVSELNISESIHVGEIAVPAGVTLLDHADVPVVSIHGKSKDVVAAEAV